MKPMLAYSKIPALHLLKYPLYASYKLDGIRCYIDKGVPYSRTGKRIPNMHVNTVLTELNLPHFDGELMVRGARDFNDVQSALMTRSGKPDFFFNVFDCWSMAAQSFEERQRFLDSVCYYFDSSIVKRLDQELVLSPARLEELMQKSVSLGYEGLIMRDPKGRYKFGRSTLREQGMLKLKWFMDDEATVVGVKELMHNIDTSSKQLANLVPGDTLGAFEVLWNGVTFEIGTGEGLTQELRKQLWLKRDQLIGARVTFKYQELSAQGIPRFPSFKAVRDARI